MSIAAGDYALTQSPAADNQKDEFMQEKRNKPNPKFGGAKRGEKKGVKAKDYFLNRKGVSEKTIKELNKRKSAKKAIAERDKNAKSERNENKKIAEDRYLVTPAAYDENFKGLSTVGSCELVIDGAIVGEREEVEIKRKRGTTFYADFVKTDEPSPVRRPVRCKEFLSCGNCVFLHIAYEKQLKIKQEMAINALEPYFADVSETVSVGEFGYRNKAHLAFAEWNRKLILGFFDDLTHEIIPVKNCLLHAEWFKIASEIILEWARSRSLRAYNPRTGKGLLRYALLRKTDEGLMLTLVINGGKLSGTETLYNSLKEKFGKVSFYTCDNKSASSSVLSGKLRLEKGEEYLSGEMSGVKFTLSPDSFYQINEKAAARIYADVLSMISASPCETVIDCFSGIGITSALFAKSGKKVISIEIVPSAVRDARRIGALNDLSGHISYFCGDAAKILPKVGAAENSIFFVDPPRGGLGEKTALMITEFSPKEIIYLSCNPNSLKEDLKTIIENGYKIVSATPYDLFPQTKHIEILVRFVRKR